MAQAHNMLEGIQMFNAATTAATTVNCFHKTTIVPPDKRESKTESKRDINVVKN
jgi:hypothetical protein